MSHACCGGVVYSMVLSPLQSITCLVQLASIRRSLFNTVERGNFLAQVMKGMKGILEQPQVLVLLHLYSRFAEIPCNSESA